MKTLPSYIVSVYLVVTTIPVILFGAISIGKDLFTEHQAQNQRYERVIAQQLLDSKKALSNFDLQQAELVATQVSQLDYVTSVKLDSMLYGMTLAEVVNRKSSYTQIQTMRYPISNEDNLQIGVLTVLKDNNAKFNDLVTSILPRATVFLLMLGSVALLFSKTISATLNKPFTELQRFALQIANGDYQTPSRTNSHLIEITQVFRSLEMMRVKLKQSIHQLKSSEEKHARTYNLTQVCLFVVNIKYNKVIRANSQFDLVFGVLPKTSKKTALAHFLNQLQACPHGKNFKYSLIIDGQARYFQVNRSETIDNEIECSALDITELVHAKQLAEKQMLMDALTQAPNRFCFNRDVEKMANEEVCEVSVLMLDLNGFKAVNDQYGHAAGDELLIQVVQRLTALLIPEQQTLYRLGGDEFIILSKSAFDIVNIDALATKVQQSIANPILLKDKTLLISTSIGISHFVQGTNLTINQTIHDADVTMYKAKSKGMGMAYSDSLINISNTSDINDALSRQATNEESVPL